MSNLSSRERAALCDTFERVGPDAPTLCGTWDTAHLAAHLVIRERHPAAVGIAVGAVAGWTERVQQETAGRSFSDLIRQIRSGPPWWSPLGLPGVEPAANTFEYFVHHEDVLRATESWNERPMSDDDQAELWHLLKKRGRLFLRRSPFSVTAAWPGKDQFVVDPSSSKSAAAKGGRVTLSGDPAELVLYLHGRQTHAHVEVAGRVDVVEEFEKLNLAL